MIIAIDVGGTKIAAALLDGTEIIERREIDSVIHKDYTLLSATIINLVQDWCSQANAVAVACTGQVTPTHVKFLSINKDAILPLKAQLEEALAKPVAILNDAAAAAWAEYAVGGHTGDNTLVYITVSTGIGGGVIQNGNLVTSSDGFNAHLGHVSVQQPHQYARTCVCGRKNCVESIASGTAIAKQASDILGTDVTCKEVFTDYLDHPEIQKLIERSADAVVDLIASIKAITGTDSIVLGGSVGLAPSFHALIAKKVVNLPNIYRVKISQPVMKANADLVGAALYLKELNL